MGTYSYIFVGLVLAALAVMVGSRFYRHRVPNVDPDAYNFVVLIVIVVLVVMAAVAYNSNQQTINNHKFCAVVHGVTDAPAQKPTNPAAKTAKQNYDWYIRFVNLQRSLGC